MTDFDPRRPFTRSQAVQAGIEQVTLRIPRYRTLFRGIYVAAKTPESPKLIAEALLLLTGPRGFVSHTSAARVYGVPLPNSPGEHVSFSSPNHRRRRAGVTSHVCPQPVTRTIDGQRVSAPEQLFVELSTCLSLVDLVVAGDHLVRRGQTSPQRLLKFCRSQSKTSATAAAYVRERVDSPMETRSGCLSCLPGSPSQK